MDFDAFCPTLHVNKAFSAFSNLFTLECFKKDPVLVAKKAVFAWKSVPVFV